MVKKAIFQMKTSKALAPSDIVLEMIRAADDTGTSMISDLAAAVICDGKVLSVLGRVSLSASTRARGMHGKGENNMV